MEYKLCVAAVDDVTRQVLVHSFRDQSVDVDHLLSTLVTSLSERHGFTSQRQSPGWSVCAQRDSLLYLSCVEPVDVEQFNTVRLQLSAR